MNHNISLNIVALTFSPDIYDSDLGKVDGVSSVQVPLLGDWCLQVLFQIMYLDFQNLDQNIWTII